MGPVLEIGDRFIRHVYVLTICLTVVIGAVLLGFKPSLLPSFLLGSALGLSLFWSIEFLVRRLIRPGKSQKTKYLFGFITLGKYAVLGVLFYFLFRMEWMNVYAFAGGIALLQGAFIIKAIGLIVSILSNKDHDQP
ncbi:MAG: ATP synthase subunit I [Candidatus Poribacteria bacterium]|nr:ATP synthase subunit I [Candidatus Poribacteria bacterium]